MTSISALLFIYLVLIRIFSFSAVYNFSSSAAYIILHAQIRYNIMFTIWCIF